MRRFVAGVDRGQGTLFPERLEDWIGEDNAVRVIDVFVEELDLVLHRRHGRAPAMPTPRGRATARSSRICWYRSIATTCRFIGRARSTLGMGSTSTARRCAIGLDKRLGCSIRSSRHSAARVAAEKSTATTRRSPCWRPALGGLRPDGSGSMSATTDHSAGRIRQPPPTSTAPIAVASTRRGTWRSSLDSFRPTAMAGSRRSTISRAPIRARSPKWRAGHCRRKFFDVWETTSVLVGSCIPRMVVVHNPGATNPMPLAVLPAQDEYIARAVDDEAYQLDRVDGALSMT